MARMFAAAAALLLALTHLSAQPTPRIGAAELEDSLDRLNTLGSVLMMAAHPDDENTSVLSYFARGRHMRTAYLSANRGEGGQNLIGTEQGALLGLIRTQELLAARRIDGAQQFFSRAIDFGYSKFPEEALEQWGRERLLADMVRVIRQYRPDVIIARFPPPPGDGGHGQHTAVGHLGPVAFEAAADPDQFPELGPAWQAKRYYWNVFNFGRRPGDPLEQAPGRLTLEIGDYDPVLGKSYSEIAGESRSMHASQGMGAAQNKGEQKAQFDLVVGDKATEDLFDGVNTSWARVPGAERVGELLAKAREDYNPNHPERILPGLLAAWKLLEPMDGFWPTEKRAELLRAIELASGLWIDAKAPKWDFTPGEKVPVELTLVNRSKSVPVQWQGGANAPYNEPQRRKVDVQLPAAISQPPWLIKTPGTASYNYADPSLIGLPEAPPLATVQFAVVLDGVALTFEKPVIYRWVDDARGERERPIQVVPPVAVSFNRTNLIFPSAQPRTVAVRVANNLAKADGKLALSAPAGWKVTPAEQAVALERKGQETTVEFQVTPPAGASGGDLEAIFTLADGRKSSHGMHAIDYPHIPIQMIYPEAKMRVERVDLKLLSHKIGYIMGAGDLIPEALQELGADVTLLTPADLAGGDLSKYDAIVAGVRAVNTRPDMLAAKERLFDYAAQGGTLVVQYNTFEFRGPSVAFGPYPLEEQKRTRDRIDRIVDENAPVKVLIEDHPLLQAPNQIHKSDFDGWVQERGLYFMGEWDQRYTAPIESADAGQPEQAGGLLYARVGKGVYIFTGYSFFRQLPAGVPGAYRLFANIVSAGKVK
ncbi:MAG: PIG-L family deacetylase [Bryobacterales bacterium]|nr:PIG-L family deacetylase [Bryobacterales bacterium]